MRKLAILAALCLALLPARPAAACGGTRDPGGAFDVIGYTLATLVVGGYAYGTGYMVYRDVTDEDQSMGYGATELMINGALAAGFGAATIESARRGNVAGALVLTGFTGLHGALAVHGGWRMYQERHPYELPDDLHLWIGGLAYTANTIYWTTQLDERRGRAFGIAEAAVNGSIAAGLGYLAIDRFQSWRGGAGVAYGGMAALSAALAVHGVRTAIDPPEAPALDLLGTDLAPTVVSDGIELAPGLGASGSW